jgi:multidrug efflux system membrane fusion protein
MDEQPAGPLAVSTHRGTLELSADEDAVPRKMRTAEPFARPLAPPRPRTGWRSRGLWLLLLVLAGAGVAWLVWRAERAAPAPAGRFHAAGPMPVGTATVATADVPIVLSALGTVTPLATVTVKPQIGGQLVEVAFKEGQMVKKGDFLAQIDPRPYQVALAQAEGQQAKDRATLRNSEVDLTRYRTLLAQNSIARQTVDTQAALVEQNRGTLQADQAQIDAQKLNLAYTRIVAPISGRLGLRQVDPGNYVQTNDAGGIVVITQVHPISVIFTLSGDELPAVMQRLRSGASLPVTALDRTGATRLASGTLETVDNQIDTSTGMVKLRAIFDNAEEALFANQFVNVQLRLDTMHDTPVIPTAAVQRGAPGTFVYLVKPDETVAVQRVALGPGSGERVAVVKGLEAGQVVVVDGADRLRDGAKVRVAGAGKPDNAGPGASPTPAGAAPTAPGERRRGQRRRGGE